MAQAATALQPMKTDPRALQFKQIFESKGFQSALIAVLPKHITATKMVRLAMGEFQRVPKLLLCTPESVLSSLLTGGAMGLEIGGPLGQGCLVPFWNGKANRLECQFIPGYRGLVKLARNSGEVEDVYAEVVYTKDAFNYEKGLNQTLTHKRNDDDMDVGQLRYAYAVGVFRSGYKKFEVMNKREVEAVKARTSSKNKQGEIVGPWVDDEGEMWKKTAVRRLAKMLPLSVDVQRMIGSEDDEIDIKLPDMAALPAFETPRLGHDDEGQEANEPATEAPPPQDDPEIAYLERIRGELAGCTTQTECNELDQKHQSQQVHELVEMRKAEIGQARPHRKKEQAGLPLGEGNAP